MKSNKFKKSIMLIFYIIGISLFLPWGFMNQKRDFIPMDCIELKNKKIHSIVEYTFYARKGFYVIITNKGNDYLLSSCYKQYPIRGLDNYKCDLPNSADKFENFQNIVKGDIIIKDCGSLNITVCTSKRDTFIVEGEDFSQTNYY